MASDEETNGASLRHVPPSPPQDLEDFTKEPPILGGINPPPPSVEYSPNRDREHVRKLIAVGLLGIVSGIVVGVVLIVVMQSRYHKGLTPDELELVLETSVDLLAPIIAVLGTVLGFYFASKDRS